MATPNEINERNKISEYRNGGGPVSKDLICEYCLKSFDGKTAKRNFVRHIQRHTGVDRRYSCDVCEKKFIQKSHLEEHKLCHTGEKPHKCQECNKAFRCKANLLRHRKCHMGLINLMERYSSYSCDTCATDCKNFDQLKNHVCEKTTDIKTMDSDANILNSLSTEHHHVTTDFANNLTKNNRNNESLVISSNTLVKLKHNVCPEPMTTRSGKVYELQVCVDKIKSRTDCATNVYDKTNNKNALKSILNQTNPRYEHQGSKNRNEARTIARKELECDDCRKLLSTTVSLAQHKKIHSKRHVCDICNQDFAEKHSLKLHQSSHIGKRDYACHYCQLSFDRKASWIKHEKIHTRSEVEKPFVCEICNKRFSKKDNMVEHSFCHTGEKPFSCGVCNFQFRSKSNLRRHKLAHGCQRYRCLICKVGFVSEIKLKYHMRVHGIYNKFQMPKMLENKTLSTSLVNKKTDHNEKQQSGCNIYKTTNNCSTDNMFFDVIPATDITSVKTLEKSDLSMTDLTIQLSERDEPDTNKDSSMPSTTTSTTSYTYKGSMNVEIGKDEFCLNVIGHRNKAEDLKFRQTSDIGRIVISCDRDLSVQESKSARSDNKSQSVTITVSGKKIIIELDSQENGEKRLLNPVENMPTCEMEDDATDGDSDQLLDTNIDVSTHMHMTDHENYCESSNNDKTCNKTSNSWNKFWKDVTVHKKNDEIYFVCNKCGISCSDHPSMRDHVQSEIHNKFACDMCDNCYSTKNGLLRHIRTHTGERPYQCEICGKSFVCTEGLRSHKITHSSVKPHYCEVCGRGFTNTGALYEHARIHSGEKIHQCETCGVSFTHRLSLKRHMTTHTGHKPYKCKQCNKSFVEMFSLKRHSMSHTGERPHKCEICGKSFMSVSHLSRHKKTTKNCRRNSVLDYSNGAIEEKPLDAVLGSMSNNFEEIKCPPVAMSVSFVVAESPTEQVVIVSDGKLGDSKTCSQNTCDNDSKIDSQPSKNNFEKACETSLIMDDGIPDTAFSNGKQCTDNTDICEEETFVELVDSESTYTVYQCTCCLNTFMKLETAMNHLCL